MSHREEELLGLEEQIRRLGLACGVDITRNEAVVALIKGDYRVCTRGDDHARKELRGLIMLKYSIEEDCIEEMGVDECARILGEVEQELKQRGFTG